MVTYLCECVFKYMHSNAKLTISFENQITK
nr:MAG TPA: hypothetical protein [Caudoviricetes sp.]DAK96438.1 MAG TPA: hypothetical protein [Caudoviricetes sp.]